MKAPNEQIIDKLCYPVIKYINEVLNIETLYCCQGKDDSNLDTENHSEYAYISFTKTRNAFNLVTYLIDNVSGDNHCIEIRGKDTKITVYFNRCSKYNELLKCIELPTKNEKIQEWQNIENTVKAYQ